MELERLSSQRAYGSSNHVQSAKDEAKAIGSKNQAHSAKGFKMSLKAQNATHSVQRNQATRVGVRGASQ